MSNTLKATFSIDTKNATASINEVNKSFLSLSKVSEATRKNIDLFAHSTQFMVNSLDLLNKGFDLTKKFITPFIEANRNAENLKTTLTSLISINAKNTDSLGNHLNALQKWNLSSKEATKILADLNQTNLKTRFSLSEVANAFTQFYSVANKQGSREQATQTFDKLAIAIQATGKDINELAIHFDNLANGSVKSSSEMAKFILSVGITNEELKKAYENAKLFDYLNEKLAKFGDMADLAGQGYDVELGKLRANITSLYEELGKPIFENITNGLKSFNEFLSQNKENIISYSQNFANFANLALKAVGVFAGVKVAVTGFNAVLAFSNSLLPIFASRLNFAVATTALMQRATALLTATFTALKSVFATLLPTAIIMSFLEFKNIQDQINDTMRTSQIEVSKFSIFIAELGRDTLRVGEMVLGGFKQLVLYFGYFINEAINNITSGISSVVNFVLNSVHSVINQINSALNSIGEKVGLSFNLNDKFKVDYDFTPNFIKENMQIYESKIKSVSLELDEVFKKLVDDTTADEIAKANERIISSNKAMSQNAGQSYGELVNESMNFANSQNEISNSARKNMQSMAEILNQKSEIYQAYYEKIGDYAKAWLIEEAKLTQKYKNLGFSEEEIKKFLEVYKRDYLGRFVSSTNGAFGEIKNSWSQTVSSMAQNISDNFFNFFTGKISSFSKMLKNLGKELLNSLFSPIYKQASSSLANVFTNFFGGGNGTNLNSVSAIASALGLSLANGVYSGTINGNSVSVLSDGTISAGSNALGGISNLMSLAGNASTIIQLGGQIIGEGGISGLYSNLGGMFQNAGNFVTSLFDTSTYTNLVSGIQGTMMSNIISPFTTVAQYLSQAGYATAAGSVASFGGGMANAMTFNTAGMSAGFGGGYAAGLGQMAGGAIIGYAVGGIGDKLIGAKTQAANLGAVGGAIGTYIYPGIGTAIGAAIGAIIGGLFGSWSVKETGLAVKGNYEIDDIDDLQKYMIQNYVKKEKKSWFSKKTKFEYSNLSNSQFSQIANAINPILYLLDEVPMTNSFLKLRAGNYSGEDFVKNELVKSVYEAVTGKYTKGGYKDLEDIMKALSQYIATYKELTTLMNGNNPVKIAKTNLDNIFSNFSMNFELLSKQSADFNSILELNAKEFRDIYSKAIKSDFSQENLDNWEKLKEAYKQAINAQKEYTNALISYASTINTLISNYYSILGKDTSELIIKTYDEQIRAISEALKYDLSKKEKEQIGDLNSFDAWNKFFDKMSFDDMRSFIENGDYELRTNLINILTSYNKTLKENLEQSLKAQLEILGKIQDEILSNTKNAFKLNLDILKEQLSVIEKFESVVKDLRNEAVGNNKNLNYEYYLSEAEKAYKNGEFDSVIFDDFIKSANERAKFLKSNTAILEDYQFEMLKMAGQISQIGGNDKQGLEEQIKDINRLLGNHGESLELTRLEIKRLNESTNSQIDILTELLGTEHSSLNYFKALLLATQNADANAASVELGNLGIATPFANGGIVTKPTNAIIGEAGYPEAVIPLKNGNGLKVDLGTAFEKLSDKLDNVEILLKNLLVNDNNKLRILRTADTGNGLIVVQGSQ